MGLSITQLEMLNVLIAMRIFGQCWKNRKVRFHVDNKAVVHALSRGKIRDIYLQTVARSIWLIAATKDIDIEYVHILGVDNVKVDVLSRMFQDVCPVEKLNLFNDYVWWPVDRNFFIQIYLCNCRQMSFPQPSLLTVGLRPKTKNSSYLSI